MMILIRLNINRKKIENKAEKDQKLNQFIKIIIKNNFNKTQNLKKHNLTNSMFTTIYLKVN